MIFNTVLGQECTIVACGPRIEAAASSPLSTFVRGIIHSGPHGVSEGESGSASGYDTGKLAPPRLLPPPGKPEGKPHRGHSNLRGAVGSTLGSGTQSHRLVVGLSYLLNPATRNCKLRRRGQRVLAHRGFLVIPSKPYYPLTLF